MARLDDVVGAILRDLELAQDVASKHSRMLAVEYANDPLLRHFPVPRTELNNVELELRFVPKAIKSEEGSSERTMSVAKDCFDRYAAQAAKALLRVASDRLERAKALPGFPQTMLTQISENLVSSEFETYVTKAIASDLFSDRARIVRPPDTMEIDRVRDATIETAARVIFEHEDLKRFIEANPKFTSDAIDAVRDALKAPLDALAQDFSNADLRAPEYELDVVLDPLELADVPTHAFSTIRIRADLRNYRWVSSPGTPEQLVQET